MNNFKRLLSISLSFLIALTLIPMEVFALPKEITITHFDYVQTNDKGDTSVRVVIEGTNFIQRFGTRNESVIKDIIVRSGAEPKSLMQGEASKQGVKVDVTDSLITITAPKNGDFTTLNINTNAKNTITINTQSLPVNTYTFDVQINDLPSMPGSLDSQRNYVGQSLDIKGRNFDEVTDVVIAGASHLKSKGQMQIKNNGTIITIDKLTKGTLNKPEKIQFIKEDIKSNKEPNNKIKPIIKFTAEYLGKIVVFEKLDNMDNLEVLPSEGPHSISSKITVRAKNNSGVILKNVFNLNNELYLRRELKSKEEEIKLINVKIVHEDPKDDSTAIVAIEGWTPSGVRPAPSTWDLIVKDKNNPTSEGIKKKAFTFISSNPGPQIIGISPSEGPDTGGTDVLITGKNIVNVNTPGIKISKGFNIRPNGNAKILDNDTLVINYKIDSAANAKYGEKPLKAIQRKIKVRIASLTNSNEGKIYELEHPPKPGDNQGSIPYGKYHFTADGTDGIVVTTTNASTGGVQDVILEMDTIFTFDDNSKITIPEATKYSPFTYNEKNPTPKVEKVELEYGFFNETAEEDEKIGVDDGVKPLMIRIKGEKFEAYTGSDGKMKFPRVQFVLPDNTVLPVLSSEEDDDTKVLDNKGNQIDGIYNKIGNTLVISVIPPKNKKYDLRKLIRSQQEQPGSFKNIEGIVQVINPSGNSNTASADSVKFQFRRPVESSDTDVNSKQPFITSVISNGAPLKKLPSDAESTVDIRVKAVAGISDLKKLIVTVDGKNISNNIKNTKLDGETAVVTVTIPKGFVGKSRLQLITPEGLMDSYNVIFDNIRGPEIKELVPQEGDKETIVIVKRDTQANEVSFKTPVETSINEQERIGSKILWNGQDMNELFKGYVKDSSGKVQYQDSDTFKNFRQENKKEASKSVKIPGKYVYVLDGDTIYFKVPEDLNLKEGQYNIQVKNPDGSESSIAKIFSIIDTIDKTKIGSISPNTDDIKGGIIVTIKAGIKNNIQTNFKGGIDVYIGTQKAEVIGYDIDNKEAYVKIPPLKDFQFPKTLNDNVVSYTLPVTIQNKVNKSTDTKNDGFVYLNPNYKVEITQIYNEKFATAPDNKDANKGVEGEYIIIRGKNFRLETGKDGKYILPRVMFGHSLAENPVAFGATNLKPDGSPQTDAQGRAELEWIKVKVPRQPKLSSNPDGSVDILVQNPDGAKAIKEKGFIYKKNNPSINEKSSVLQASRFHDTITINAKDVSKEGLVIAFGDKKYEKELSSTQMELETTKEVEKIVVRYIPNTNENIEIYYKKPDGNLILMTDTQGTNSGKARLSSIGDKIIVGLNWKNKDYHSTGIIANKELLNSLNTEYMEIYTENKAPNINSLVVRRSLGKLTDYKIDNSSGDAQLTIKTPYNDRAENTKISLINPDGSSAQAPFIFHGGIDTPEIQDIDSSKNRDVTIKGKNIKAKVYTSDYTSDSEITVIGKNFKDIKKILVGDKLAEIINISSDYTRVKIKVPKGSMAETGNPLPITIVTKDGTGYSDRANPPVYFMYIQAGTKPVLSSVVPNKSPQTGGTRVVINGNNFRETDEFGIKGDIEVYFSGKKAKIEKFIRNEKGDIVAIQSITPEVKEIDENSTVVVKNADEAKSQGLAFKYISQPIIEKMEGQFRFNSEKNPDEDDVKVTIIGKNFYNPKKVIIGGKLIKIDKNRDKIENAMMQGVKSDASNQYVELEKDKDGKDKGIVVTSIQRQENDKQLPNTTSFTITIPQITFEEMNNMASKSVIVINSDGGTSSEVPADIKLPVPDVPKILALPGNLGTIILSWEYKSDDANKATRFEIYAKEYESSNDYNHIGDLQENQDKNNFKYNYTIKDLKPDTKYQIKLRAMNKFGEAEDFGYATVTTLRKEDDNKAKEKEEELERAQNNIRKNGVKSLVGDTLKYTVGTKEEIINISGYPNIKTKEVRIPVSQIKLSPNTNIQINDNKMALSVPFRAFDLNQVKTASDNAVVSLRIKNNDNKINTKIGKLIPKNKKRASQVHKVEFDLQEPKKTIPIKFTNYPLKLSLIPSDNSKNTILSRYDEKTNTVYQNVNSNLNDGGYYVLLKNK